MRTHISPRAKAITVALATPLALAGLSVTAAPAAHADTIDPTSMIGVVNSLSTNEQGADNCSNVNATSPAPVAITSDSQSVVGATAGSTTLNGNAADTATATASTSGSLAVARTASGQLSKITLSTSVTASQTVTGNGARCNLAAGSLDQVLLGFTLAQPRYLTFTGTSKSAETIGFVTPGTIAGSSGGGLGGALFGLGVDDTSAVQLSGGKNATGTSRLLLPAGNYFAVLGGGGGSTKPGVANGSAVVTLSFDTPGAALTAASGKGGKYVALPSTITCSTSTAAATWTAKAGKKKVSHIKKATFKVGAQKVGSAKKTTKGDTTTLKALPTGGPFTVTASIKLDTGKTVTVERDYQACTA